MKFIHAPTGCCIDQTNGVFDGINIHRIIYVIPTIAVIVGNQRERHFILRAADRAIGVGIRFVDLDGRPLDRLVRQPTIHGNTAIIIDKLDGIISCI